MIDTPELEAPTAAATAPTQPFSMNWLESPLVMTLAAALCIFIAAHTAWTMLGHPLAGADDADIFLVYARNFAHGAGMVYTPGGEHVEGFSSMLYMLVASACFVVTAHPERLLYLLNAVFVIAALVLLLRTMNALARDCGVGGATRALIAAALLTFVTANPCFAAWNIVTLMDGGLYALTIAWALALCVASALGRPFPREFVQAAAAVAALVLVRPEGAAWALLLVATFFVLHRRKAWLPAVTFAVVLPWLLAFRVWYFGFPLPNTYYAKVSSSLASTLSDGWAYAQGCVALWGAAALLPLIAGAAAVAYLWLRPPSRRDSAWAATIVIVFTLAGCLLPVLEGGDHFFAARMYQPIYPLLGACALLPVIVIAELRAPWRAAIYVALCAALISFSDKATWPAFAASNVPATTDVRFDLYDEFLIDGRNRSTGAELTTFFAPQLPSVGFAAAGGIAYGYGGRVIDLMGLNETQMAHADLVKTGPKGHQSFNRVVFFALAPDILMPATLPSWQTVSLDALASYYTRPGSWDNLIFKNIFNDPAFRATYTLALVSNDARPGLLCYGYFNRVYLARLTAGGGYRTRATHE